MKQALHLNPIKQFFPFLLIRVCFLLDSIESKTFCDYKSIISVLKKSEFSCIKELFLSIDKDSLLLDNTNEAPPKKWTRS